MNTNVGLVESTVAVSLNIGLYTGRRQDKKASSLVAAQEGVEESVGRYWKDSMKCDELNRIKGLATALRLSFYRFSLPWREGIRIMPVSMIIPGGDFVVAYTELQCQWDLAVDSFVSNYPWLVQVAQKRLKGMYNADDYPAPEDVRAKFSLDLSILPVPTADDFRISLVGAQMEEIKNNLTARMQTAQSEAIKDLWARIGERVKVMHSTFSDPNKRFSESMIEHTKELCEDVAKLNFTKDPALEAIRQEVERELASLNVDALRADNIEPTGYRAQAADAAKAILDKVRNMGGIV